MNEDDFILDQQIKVEPWHHSRSHQYLQEEKQSRRGTFKCVGCCCLWPLWEYFPWCCEEKCREGWRSCCCPKNEKPKRRWQTQRQGSYLPGFKYWSLHKRKTRDNATGKELLIMKEGINRTHTGNRKSNVRRQKLINNGIEKRETLMRKDIRAAGINT